MSGWLRKLGNRFVDLLGRLAESLLRFCGVGDLAAIGQRDHGDGLVDVIKHAQCVVEGKI